MSAKLGTIRQPSTGAQSRPRRSKGCGTCRQRKVKCDLTRPTCERCQKNFHHCLGYSEPRIFINFHSPPSKGRLRSGRGEESQVNPSPGSLSYERRMLNDISSGVSVSMPMTAFADEIMFSHLMEQMSLRSRDIPTFNIHTKRTNTAGRSKQPSGAYIAALSVAKALFGRIYHQDKIVHEAAQLYSQALQGVREDVSNLRTRQNSVEPMETLWSSLFLGLYEMIASSGAADWLRHSLGVAALTQLIGPHGFQQKPALRLLESNRSLIAIGAIVLRKRSFLEQAIWQAVPWALEMEPRTTLQRLDDILCTIPGLLEDADMLQTARSNDEPWEDLQCTLHRKVSDVHLDLLLLKQQWDKETEGAYWDQVPRASTSVSVDLNGEAIFESVLCFCDIDIATRYIQFNTLSLLLRAVLRAAGLACSYPGTTASSQPWSEMDIVTTSFEAEVYHQEREAMEICRTVDYMSLPQHGCRGPFLLLFPLRVASGNLGQHPKVLAWLRSILLSISQAKGFEIGQHILSVSAHDLQAM